MPTFQYAVHVLILLAGGLWLLKKVTEMDRYHYLRVWILTSVLSFLVIYFFLAYGAAMLGVVPYDDCFSFSGNSTTQY